MSSTRPEHPADADATPAEPAAVPEAAPEPVAQPGVAEPETTEPADAGEEDDVLLVDPAKVRRAPRYKAFFTTGAVVGVIVGVALGAWFTGVATQEGVGLLKPGVYVSVVVLGSTTFFVLLAGALAVLADRRSLRRR
ncbi:hypothetical protein ATJ88_0489 [Isoptericola jiangsuensis]|uniref:Uncharacterized protein n=1 Tax=Isoptericola jiangsuensis TaxID=548579 RepID=A0A2A9EUD4_9MICO|nr:hypothetical protein [Isoptericola jiangsuensis]PFG41845.1 hypothetical protein ATJ88_0489 [Isoptericola jiangsuensis]